MTQHLLYNSNFIVLFYTTTHYHHKITITRCEINRKLLNKQIVFSIFLFFNIILYYDFLAVKNFLMDNKKNLSTNFKNQSTTLGFSYKNKIFREDTTCLVNNSSFLIKIEKD